MPQTDHIQELINQANEIIEQVNADQERIDGFYRAENLDPEKILEFANNHMDEQVKNKALEMAEQDLMNIEKEVNDEAERRSIGKASASSPIPKHKIMI